MHITWEDRKGSGKIDVQLLVERPIFSFEYAWIMVNDSTAQFVESHNEGVYNSELSTEQLAEVVSFYSSYVFDAAPPEYNPDIEKISMSDSVSIIDGKKFKSYDIIPLTPSELDAKLITKIEQLKDAKRNDIRDEFDVSLAPSVSVNGIEWNSGFNSSLSIDGAARISAAAGATSVTVHSLDNKPHTLSIAAATQVAVMIGADYQQKFSFKQSRMVALDEIDSVHSDAIAQIAAI